MTRTGSLTRLGFAEVPAELRPTGPLVSDLVAWVTIPAIAGDRPIGPLGTLVPLPFAAPFAAMFLIPPEVDLRPVAALLNGLLDELIAFGFRFPVLVHEVDQPVRLIVDLSAVTPFPIPAALLDEGAGAELYERLAAVVAELAEVLGLDGPSTPPDPDPDPEPDPDPDPEPE